MKIAYQHLLEHIHCRPSIEEISEKLFQLGHEHEIQDSIYDIEFTPNRGDCLSVRGLLRDLAVFYKINFEFEEYNQNIDSLKIDFVNSEIEKCPYISFLKIELDDLNISNYSGPLKKYFDDLDINKNNFFTDVSNYISYETGQPTHCYDSSKIKGTISIKEINDELIFSTLVDKEINLTGKNLVFLDDTKVVNLAGVMGGKDTACSDTTKSVIVECAYFNPEDIIGKTVKYDIQSDAAYKFERGVDPKSQEGVLRRFIKIISDHANIKNVSMFTKNYQEYKYNFLPFNTDVINEIIGTEISADEYMDYLIKLGFSVTNNLIKVPSFRNDISSQNDLAEEIARFIGFNNIPIDQIKILHTSNESRAKKENKIKNLLIDNGFYEVINNPFDVNKTKESLKIDNPLDSNRGFFRTNLKNSLIENLLYNERRQKDSIKLFEISDIYCSSEKCLTKKKVIGIIAAGRVGRDHVNFSKKISNDFILSILNNFVVDEKINFEEVDQNVSNRKSNYPIVYIQMDIEDFSDNILEYKEKIAPPEKFVQYMKISEFPSSVRDLSFSVKDFSKLKVLDNAIHNFKYDLLKEVFLFDYYENEKMREIKAGYRFIFQSNTKTLTDNEIDELMADIIEKSLKIESISIPGL